MRWVAQTPNDAVLRSDLKASAVEQELWRASLHGAMSKLESTTAQVIMDRAVEHFSSASFIEILNPPASRHPLATGLMMSRGVIAVFDPSTGLFQLVAHSTCRGSHYRTNPKDVVRARALDIRYRMGLEAEVTSWFRELRSICKEQTQLRFGSVLRMIRPCIEQCIIATHLLRWRISLANELLISPRIIEKHGLPWLEPLFVRGLGDLLQAREAMPGVRSIATNEWLFAELLPRELSGIHRHRSDVLCAFSEDARYAEAIGQSVLARKPVVTAIAEVEHLPRAAVRKTIKLDEKLIFRLGGLKTSFALMSVLGSVQSERRAEILNVAAILGRLGTSGGRFPDLIVEEVRTNGTRWVASQTLEEATVKCEFASMLLLFGPLLSEFMGAEQVTPGGDSTFLRIGSPGLRRSLKLMKRSHALLRRMTAVLAPQLLDPDYFPMNCVRQLRTTRLRDGHGQALAASFDTEHSHQWETLAPRCCIDGFDFLPLSSYEELSEEASAMRHCVASPSYVRSASRGVREIMHVQQIGGSDKRKDGATLSLTKSIGESGSIVVSIEQLKGYRNRAVSSEMHAAARVYAEVAGNSLNTPSEVQRLVETSRETEFAGISPFEGAWSYMPEDLCSEWVSLVELTSVDSLKRGFLTATNKLRQHDGSVRIQRRDVVYELLEEHFLRFPSSG